MGFDTVVKLSIIFNLSAIEMILQSPGFFLQFFFTFSMYPIFWMLAFKIEN